MDSYPEVKFPVYYLPSTFGAEETTARGVCSFTDYKLL